MISNEQSVWNSSTEELFSEAACVLFIDCMCLGASCMLRVVTVKKRIHKGWSTEGEHLSVSDLYRNGWMKRWVTHTKTSMYWERIAAYKHHNYTEIIRQRCAVKLNGHLSCMCAASWEDWVQILVGSNFSGSASGASDHVWSPTVRCPGLLSKETQLTTCQACNKSV